MNQNWIDRVNNDPAYNIAVAFDTGIKVPEYVFLNSKKQEEIEDMMISNQWEFMSDIAVRKEEGVSVTLNFLWNGNEFLMPLLAFKDNKMLTGSQGIVLQDNLITLFQIADINRIIAPQLKKLTSIMKNKANDYVGFVQIDVILNFDKVLYHRIQFGTSIDMAYSVASICAVEPEDMIESFKNDIVPEIEKDYVSSLRIFGYPYEPSHNLATIEKAFEIGVLDSSDVRYGSESGLYAVSGQSVSQSWKNLYRKINHIGEYGLCYRTDGGDVMRKKFSKLKSWSYI